jgi:hypothetical protein
MIGAIVSGSRKKKPARWFYADDAHARQGPIRSQVLSIVASPPPHHHHHQSSIIILILALCYV